MPKVYHKNDPNVPKDAVYVGRPSKWGNPYQIGKHGNRASVISQFEGYLRRKTVLNRQLHELRGKDLVCWCAPEPCHADVLLKAANSSDYIPHWKDEPKYKQLVEDLARAKGMTVPEYEEDFQRRLQEALDENCKYGGYSKRMKAGKHGR